VLAAENRRHHEPNPDHLPDIQLIGASDLTVNCQRTMSDIVSDNVSD